MAETDPALLDPADEHDRLEIAAQLYERFCADLVDRSDKARVRLISGIQVALRDASEGLKTQAPMGRVPDDGQGDLLA